MGEMQLDNSGWTWHGLGMDLTKLGPLLTSVGISLMGGGVVAVPKTAPAWVEGVVVVIGAVMVAFGQYFSHQTTKDIKAVQDDHSDRIALGEAVDLGIVNAPKISKDPISFINPPPAGSLVGALQSPPTVPTIKTP